MSVHIGDNSDDDAARAIVNEFSHSLDIKYFRHTHNIGAALNFKFLVESVGTDCYHILSDDDMLAPGVYDKWEVLHRREPVSFYCFRTLVMNLVTSRCEVLPTNWKAAIYRPSLDVISTLADSHFCTTSVIFDRRAIVANPLLDDPFGSDQAAIIRLAATNSFSVSEQIGGVFFFDAHNQSWSTRNTVASAAEALSSQLACLTASGLDTIPYTAEALVARLYAEIFASITKEQCMVTERAPHRMKSFGIRSQVKRVVRALVHKRTCRSLSEADLSDLQDPSRAFDMVSRKCSEIQ